jgi:hypothetical protein
MLRSVFREADAGLHRVGAVEVTCTTGEEEGVVCGHVTGAGTATSCHLQTGRHK